MAIKREIQREVSQFRLECLVATLNIVIQVAAFEQLQKMFSYTIDLYQLLQLIVGIFITFILFKILKLFRKRWTLMEAMKPFPGPPSHWLYGHALEVCIILIVNEVVLFSESYLSQSYW